MADEGVVGPGAGVPLGGVDAADAVDHPDRDRSLLDVTHGACDSSPPARRLQVSLGSRPDMLENIAVG